MKLNLCLNTLCFYLALSAASTIPDKNYLENDADQTSHDQTHAPHPPPPADPYLLPRPPASYLFPIPAPLPDLPHDLPHAPPPPPTHEPEIPPQDYLNADRTSHDATEHEYAVADENDAIPDDWVLTGHSAVPTAPAFKHPIQTPVDVVIPAPADENDDGFQPESSALPVAPALPHPIPQFRID